jgi:hypothetical protein
VDAKEGLVSITRPEQFAAPFRAIKLEPAEFPPLTRLPSSMKSKASRKHTKEYNKARARYPSPDAY